MNINLKIFLISLLAFGLGAGGFYAWSRYYQIQLENASLKNQISDQVRSGAIVQNTPTPKLAIPTAMAEPTLASATGSVTGTLGYPSEGIPPLEIFIMNTSDYKKFYKIETLKNQSNFTVESISPGTYIVFAYPIDNNTFAGGYTQAVPCGLSVDCPDHSLIQIKVKANQATTGVEIKDWYAPANTFPAKP